MRERTGNKIWSDSLEYWAWPLQDEGNHREGSLRWGPLPSQDSIPPCGCSLGLYSANLPQQTLHTREVPSWNFKGNLLTMSSRLGLLYSTSLQTVNTSIPGKYSDSFKYLSYDLAWILFMYLDCLLFFMPFFKKDR